MSAIRDETQTWGGATPLRLWLLAAALFVGAALFFVAANSASAAEPIGVYMAGEESEEGSEQPRFEAESYPAYLSSAGATTFTFGFQAGTMECPGELAGQLSGESTTLALAPFYNYPWCKVSSGAAVTLSSAFGCEYVLHADNAGPPYTGAFELSCPEGGAIEFEFWVFGKRKCTIVYPSQSGVAAIDFENTGEGSERAIDVAFDLTGLTYVQVPGEGFGKCTGGEFENGTYSGTTTLVGSDE